MTNLFKISAAAMVVVFFTACGPSEKELLKAELEQLKIENEEFKKKEGEMTVSIESYKTLLSEINQSLSTIDNTTVLTKKMKAEMNNDANVGEIILTRIKSIAEMMENAKMKVQALDRTLVDLRKKFGDQSEEVLALNRELKKAAQELIDRENEFEAMKSEYEGEIEGLEEAYAKQLKIAEDLKDLLDRAFYFAGTRQELSEKNIVDKEGGFIGIGRVKVLNASAPERMFSKISKETTNEISLPVRKMELITDHDPASYTIVSDDAGSKLTIKDKKAFWKNANYLVIQTTKEKGEG